MEDIKAIIRIPRDGGPISFESFGQNLQGSAIAAHRWDNEMAHSRELGKKDLLNDIILALKNVANL